MMSEAMMIEHPFKSDVPLLTVITPVYNGMPHLRDTVESILSQQGIDFVYHLVSDGSKDGSDEYLRSLTDPRVKVTCQANKGLCQTLNEAMVGAETPFIARIDQDDLALPGRLRDQFEFLDSHPQCGAVLGNLERITDRGSNFGSHLSFPSGTPSVAYRSETFGCVVHSTLMLRREAFEALGGYRQAMYPVDDFDLLLRMEERFEIGFLTRPVIRYRIHGNAGSFTTSGAMDWKTEFALANARSRRQDGHELDMERFATDWASRPWHQKMGRNLVTRGRLHFRTAGLLLGERRVFQGAWNLALASLLAPKYTSHRIIDMVRYRLKGHA